MKSRTLLRFSPLGTKSDNINQVSSCKVIVAGINLAAKSDMSKVPKQYQGSSLALCTIWSFIFLSIY